MPTGNETGDSDQPSPWSVKPLWVSFVIAFQVGAFALAGLAVYGVCRLIGCDPIPR